MGEGYAFVGLGIGQRDSGEPREEIRGVSRRLALSERRKNGQAGGQVVVIETRQAAPSRTRCRDSCQTPFGIAAVGLNVQVGQGFDHPALGDAEMAHRDQMIGQGPGFVAGPVPESSHKLVAGDDPVLKGEQAKEQVARGDHSLRSRGPQSPCRPPRGAGTLVAVSSRPILYA